MRSVFVVVAVVAVAGCGRFGFGERVALADGGDMDASAFGDANLGNASCNPISRIADDFESSVVNAELWGGSYTDPGTTDTHVGGEVLLTPASNVASAYVGHQTLRYFDMRGQRIVVEVAQVAGGGATTGIGITYEGKTYVHLAQQAGQLLADRQLAGVYKRYASIPYTNQPFWAISEQAGMIAFETSPDGVTFTAFATVPAPFDTSLVRATMFAGAEGLIAVPTAAHFASFNRGLASGAPACPATTLTDTFSAPTVGHIWTNGYTQACCTVSQSGGHIQIATTGTAGYAALRSAAGYDLHDNEISVAVPSGPSSASAFYGVLGARMDASNGLELNISETTFTAHTTINGTSATFVSSRAGGDDFARLRESAGTFYFEKSSDRQSWFPVYTLATPFAVTDVMLTLEGGLTTGSTASMITFDDVNVP